MCRALIFIILRFYNCILQVNSKYESQLEELMALERHLVQAKARALADDERNLVTLSESCPGYQDIGLPKGEGTERW